MKRCEVPRLLNHRAVIRVRSLDSSLKWLYYSWLKYLTGSSSNLLIAPCRKTVQAWNCWWHVESPIKPSNPCCEGNCCLLNTHRGTLRAAHKRSGAQLCYGTKYKYKIHGKPSEEKQWVKLPAAFGTEISSGFWGALFQKLINFGAQRVPWRSRLQVDVQPVSWLYGLSIYLELVIIPIFH